MPSHALHWHEGCGTPGECPQVRRGWPGNRLAFVFAEFDELGSIVPEMDEDPGLARTEKFLTKVLKGLFKQRRLEVCDQMQKMPLGHSVGACL